VQVTAESSPRYQFYFISKDGYLTPKLPDVAGYYGETPSVPRGSTAGETSDNRVQ
jgi:hypothetical protein